MAAMSNGHAANDPKEKGFTIIVKNVPMNLEQDAIQLKFERYGKVTGCITFPNPKENSQVAYISYQKYNEAETAINEMDNIPPLNLQIEFKDKDLKTHQEKINIRLDNTPQIDYRYQDSILDKVQGSNKAINMGKPKCTPAAYQVCNYTTEDELLCPVPTDPSMYNPYEQPGPYKDLNLMYSRGITQITKDGRRRICFGRGYTFYDLPEPHHNMDNLVANVCEIRNSGYYEYAPDDMDDDSGICKICSTPTAFRCQKCNTTFYCSRPCQLKDWPQHKIDCQSIPNLVKKIPSMSLQNGNQAAKQNGYKSPLKIHEDSSPKEPEPQQLRRPKTLPQSHQQAPRQHQQQQQRQQSPPRWNRDQQQQQGPQSPPRFNRDQQQQRSPSGSVRNQRQSPPSSVNQEKPMQRSPAASVKSQASNHRGTESKNDANRQTPVTAFKAESTSFPVKQQKAAETKLPSDDGIGFTPVEWFISKDKFERVVINSQVEKGQYWVQKVDSYEAIEELFDKLKSHAKGKKREEPQVHTKCILEYEDAWYRAVIIDINENTVKAFFTDFGTSTDVEIKGGVVPSDGFENIPSHSRRIRFVEGTDPKFDNLETGYSLYVKAVNFDDGVLDVEVKEDKNQMMQLQEAASTETSVPEATRQPTPRQIALEKLASFPNILNAVQVNQTGALMLSAQLARNELGGSLIPEGTPMQQFELLCGQFGEDCLKQIAQNPNYEPIIGDFICGEQAAGEWYRGIVISLNPVKLAIVDEARVFVPQRCTTLPKGYHDIAGYGVLIKLTANAELANQSFDFKVISVSKDTVVVSLTSDEVKDFSAEATLVRWTPKPEQKGIQWAKLTSGKDVQIIDAFSQNLIYVHSKEPEECERRHRVEQEIAKCALNRKPLRDLPVVGQIVMAHYENDGNYYRAYVVRVESKTNIQIRYIDYGNEANVKFEQLFELPDELKEERACAAKIKLKGVEEKTPMTTEATEFLSELITHEVPLTCTFTGSPFTDGVVLKTPKNDIVNDLLTAFLKPTWQQNNNVEVVDKPIYLVSDLPALKIGDVGDQVQAIALCFYEDPPSLMLAPNDEAMIEAIQGDMVLKIQEYAINTPEHYIPREKELCIAMYDGNFYRAICVHSSASPNESRLMFIDYGNTELIKHKDIRMMTPEFMIVGPLATLCSILPMVPEDKLTPAVIKRLSELLPVNELITIKIISEDPEDGTPYINIPEIQVKLIDEKLL